MSTQTTVNIPTEILESARLTVSELKLELAIALYAQRRLSIGKARELAGLPLVRFRHILAAREIPVHYDLDDLEHDFKTAQEMQVLSQPGRD